MSCGYGYYDDDIAGLGKSDFSLIVGVPLGYIAAAKLDNYLVFDEDGKLKEGQLAEDPQKRQGLYVLLGGVAYYFGGRPESGELGDFLKGIGLGSATFGVKEFIRSRYPEMGINGTKKRSNNPKTISGTRRQHSNLHKTIGSANRANISFNQKTPTKQSSNLSTTKIIRA